MEMTKVGQSDPYSVLDGNERDGGHADEAEGGHADETKNNINAI